MSHIEVVDPTRLNNSLQCLRLYYWCNERHIVPVKPRLPLVYGRGSHATLASHYRGEAPGMALKEFDDIWEADVIPFLTEMDEEDPKRNPVRWAETFLAYRKYYSKEPFKVLFVEAPFFLPLSDDIALGGIIDLLVEWLNQKMVMDHKTTSVTYPSYFAGFNPNHQFSSYLLGATELLGEEVTTCYVNNLVVLPKNAPPERMFMRTPTNRSIAQHQMMKDELLGWWGIVRECRRTGNWPRNPDRCQRWAGGCEYHPLCTEIQTNFKKLIPSKAMYREEVWDPIAELRKHGLEETI